MRWTGDGDKRHLECEACGGGLARGFGLVEVEDPVEDSRRYHEYQAGRFSKGEIKKRVRRRNVATARAATTNEEAGA